MNVIGTSYFLEKKKGGGEAEWEFRIQECCMMDNIPFQLFFFFQSFSNTVASFTRRI